MPNPLEQLNELELKANFTPPERQYFYKLRDELEAIVGGVSIEKLDKPGDVVRARRIRAKLEDILKFVQDRKMKKIEVVDKKSFMEWLRLFDLDEKLTKNWIDKNIEFDGDLVIWKVDPGLFGTQITYLPNNLQVDGALYLDNCGVLKSLPESLRVKGPLWLNDCSELIALSNDLWVEGDLSLQNCSALKSLPETLKVGGRVFASGCSPETIEELRDMKKRGQITGNILTNK